MQYVFMHTIARAPFNVKLRSDWCVANDHF